MMSVCFGDVLTYAGVGRKKNKYRTAANEAGDDSSHRWRWGAEDEDKECSRQSPVDTELLFDI
ncbi:hypothetical protein BDQ12DRAFT_676632, partial [Crucibulum laeve]